MIRIESVNSAYSLAGMMAIDGRHVEAVAGTPLHALAVESTPATKMRLAPEDIVVVSEARNVLKEAVHSSIMDDAVDVIAQSVNAQVRVVRETVKPIVLDAIEKIGQAMDDHEKNSGRFKVEIVEYPEIYNDTMLQDLAGKYESMPARELPWMRGFPELDQEGLEAIFKIGIRSLDEKLVKYLEGTENMLERVYNESLLRKPHANIVAIDPRNEAICLFVLGKYLQANVLEGATIDLDTYRHMTAELLSEAGRRLSRVIRKRDAEIRRNKLFITYPKADETYLPIKVNGDVYHKFVQAGGTVEHLIGAVLRNITDPIYQDLLDDEYGQLKAVQNNEKMIAARFKAEEEALVTKATIEYFRGIINDADNYPEGGIEIKLDAVRDLLKARPYKAKADLQDWVMWLVCTSFYEHLNAYYILSSINTTLNENPDMDPREAATLVVIDLLADFLVDQMVVY